MLPGSPCALPPPLTLTARPAPPLTPPVIHTPRPTPSCLTCRGQWASEAECCRPGKAFTEGCVRLERCYVPSKFFPNQECALVEDQGICNRGFHAYRSMDACCAPGAGHAGEQCDAPAVLRFAVRLNTVLRCAALCCDVCCPGGKEQSATPAPPPSPQMAAPRRRTSSPRRRCRRTPALPTSPLPKAP